MSGKLLVGRTFVRKYSSLYVDGKFDINAVHPGADKTAAMWKKLTFFVAIPTVALGLLNSYLMTQEEEKTMKRPEFKPYDHMRVRTKRFPWGDGQRTFFHNPHRNALPSGYEAEEEHHH